MKLEVLFVGQVYKVERDARMGGLGVPAQGGVLGFEFGSKII